MGVQGVVSGELYGILVLSDAPKQFLGKYFFRLWIRSSRSGLEDFNTDNLSIKVAPKAASNVIFGPVAVL
ncbi:uncharacterized protein METZ01_LOCUS170335 [marine metagenome]|uniref:Uncharacterized protein n=1 Tax=marine metagenome TaxID=408172 RepID=A0A382BVG3_9ZZZZ